MTWAKTTTIDGRYDPSSPVDTIATTIWAGTPGVPNEQVSGVGSVSLSPEVTAEKQPRKKTLRVEPPRGQDTR